MQPEKGQSAIEYLMTYAWAFVIIAVIAGALVGLGVFKISGPSAQPGGCSVVRPLGPLSQTGISLEGVCTGLPPQFVGTFSGNGGVSVPGTSGANTIGLSLSTFTAWVDPTSLTSNGYIFDDYGHFSFNKEFSVIDNPDGTNDIELYSYLWDNSYSVPVAKAPANTIGTPNKWYFIAGTINTNSVATVMYLYVNGVQVANSIGTTSLSLGAPTNPAVPFAMGIGNQIIGTNSFVGYISNVQIYNRTLSANAIKSLYIEGIGGPPSYLNSLVAWYPLNLNGYDYSGNGYNATTNSIGYSSSWTAGYTVP